jgi:predicted dehydrogenase
MRVGIIGIGAIANKHALAYRNLGFQITACTNRSAERGRQFAQANGAHFVATPAELCARPDVDFVDVCTFPDYRLEAVRLCAARGKDVLVQKPMAVDLATAREMIEIAREAGIQLGVVSQHRFDDATTFLKKAITDERLGRILQADAYVKWWRSAEYYSRPIKGSWEVEGGGALINQAIHQVDLLLYLAGAVDQVFGYWQLGAMHKIQAEDNLSALLRYANGATGVIQASTALWPGYPERIEIHGTRGTAIIAGDKLIHWDVQDDSGKTAPVLADGASGASDPMAISVAPFERQFQDFADACESGRRPLIDGEDGYRALQLVMAIYESCRMNKVVNL